MMQLYCSRYLNDAYRFYWRSMRLCYPNPPFSQLAKVLTKTALKGARVVLCTPVCNFLELGQFGSPNSKGVSKGRFQGVCLGALRGEHSLKVARRARAGQTFPHYATTQNSPIWHLAHAFRENALATAHPRLGCITVCCSHFTSYTVPNAGPTKQLCCS